MGKKKNNPKYKFGVSCETWMNDLTVLIINVIFKWGKDLLSWKIIAKSLQLHKTFCPQIIVTLIYTVLVCMS